MSESVYRAVGQVEVLDGTFKAGRVTMSMYATLGVPAPEPWLLEIPLEAEAVERLGSLMCRPVEVVLRRAAFGVPPVDSMVSVCGVLCALRAGMSDDAARAEVSILKPSPSYAGVYLPFVVFEMTNADARVLGPLLGSDIEIVIRGLDSPGRAP